MVNNEFGSITAPVARPSGGAGMLGGASQPRMSQQACV